ncbi:uncharacterized protein LOC126377479 [Pectinophora gossypiella]|uniref:uncharacterized protein LOC126377479 n=1 Tax=Pectinophora gossypiella TaxID=13191 RepID=UPI00214E9C99|nr:uncharacterized protein LOC126377479 [Pectinophora gossypiella]
MGRVIGGLFVLCTIAVGSALFTGKGFYCRDPDTGKLYPVNTTWASSSFCGSYTCKLRKKNNTTDEPLRQLKIGNVDQPQKETARIVKHEGNCTRPIGVVIEPPKSNIQNILHKEKTDDANYVSLDNFKNIELNSVNKDSDRYLTEQEIKALTMLLHTVKKSDLEAILEIYDLAQDIYKEADRVGDDEVLFQNTNAIEEEKLTLENKPTVRTEAPKVKNYVSYWYEPLTSSNNKHSIDQISPALPTAKDTSNEIKPVPIKSKEAIHEPISPKFKSKAEAYFSRALTNQDFRMLPYYFPMSKFNRQSSYHHTNPGGPLPVPSSNHQGVQIPQLVPVPQPVPIPQTTMTRSPPIGSYPLLIPNTQLGSQHVDNILATVNKKPCKHPDGPIKKISPWFKLIKKPFIYDPENKQYDLQRRPITYTESRINAQTLHYPFAYLNYNLSNLQNLYVNEYPWSFLNLHKDHQHNHPNYLKAAYMAHLPHAFLINQDLPDDSMGEEQKPIAEKEKKLPDWQTEQLPMSILNEVRANMANTKLLPFPFRKKVKLEKVSKVIKMDDLSRSRRHANVANAGNPEEFEVYLEKSTCTTDTEPGFFRMGNATEPFPACCPQRIGS